MKIGVLGSGLMGKEAARDLVLSSGVKEVGLADINIEEAEKVCRVLSSPKLIAYKVDATNKSDLAKFMKKFDVIINALFYTFNETVAKVAIEVGVSSVDLGGHIGHITDKVLLLHEEAQKKGITIIPDLGVAPGMINILSGYGASKLDELQSIKLYVGGIPVYPEPPLFYNHVFSMEGLLDHYTDKSVIIREGKHLEVDSLSEIEEIKFDTFGELEAFHTSGGTSTLVQTFPDIETLEYKTIRYAGHDEKFKFLVDLNLTRRDYAVDIRDVKIAPREVLLKVLEPFVSLGEKDDVVLLRVFVSGIKDNHPVTYEYEMVTYKNKIYNITAMARATATTISIVAQFIGDGTIEKKGVFPPEQIVPGKKYIEELAKRDVHIKEKIINRKI